MDLPIRQVRRGVGPKAGRGLQKLVTFYVLTAFVSDSKMNGFSGEAHLQLNFKNLSI